ncbi:amidohydrolase [Streptomyces sp. TS71-3]|nr:amidohydrolase [Streptomyces sp. TS71-3]
MPGRAGPPGGSGAVVAEGAQAAEGAPTRRLTFTEGTNASVTASPRGDRLILEVQGVLWAVAREGGTATALTGADLDPARVAWSPDGSVVAVCAYRDGGFHLWTMRPDGSGLKQLTSGPWDDRGVAWSPDGTRLAFASERGGDPAAGSRYRIWTVDVRSGELAPLTDDAGVEDYDPAWHPDGDKVFFVRADAQGGRTLASVPAARRGGAVTVERTVDSGTLVGPAVSADGRVACVHVAGAVQGENPASATLLVDGAPLTDGEDVSPQPPCWTADGTLLYLADGHLRARRPAGSAPGARSGSAPAAAAETIPFTAVLEQTRPRYRRKRFDFDSTAARPVRGVHLPVLAPDGQSVAFVALNTLWVMPVGGRPRALVRGIPTAYVQMPSWDPDGRSVVYAYDGDPNTGGPASDGLTAVRRHWLGDGKDELLAGGGRLNPVLSPDGTRLACHDTTGNLFVRDLAAGKEEQVIAPLGANGLPGRPSWSPDGRFIAFCDRNRLNQRFREGYNVIRVVDVAAKEASVHQPMPHASLSDRGNCGPVWSPDGTAMAFIMDSALWVLPVSPQGAPTGEPVRITDEAADHPSWSGDSRHLLYETSGRLRLVGRDGSGARSIGVPLRYARAVPPRGEVTRVHAGRLWDGTGERVLTDVDIVIAGHRIVAVEQHRAGGSGAGERLIDASGTTVLPGLWDAHTHPWQYTYGGRQTSLNLAYGITSNASLGGFAHEGARIRESVAAGRQAGPRLFATGELIDGSRVAYSMGRAHRTPDGVRRSLDRAVALGYDFVKTYVRAPASTMREAARTAHERLGVPSGSHLLSPGASVGQDLTTHLQATQRSEYGRAYSPTGHSYQDVHETYRGGDFAIVITPFTAISLIGADPDLARDPRVTSLMAPWDAALIEQYAAKPPSDAAILAVREEVAVYKRILADGGRLALGTDAPLTPIGLHVHMGLRALYRYGGLSVAEVLRTATSVPARLFGAGDDLGTVEPGKLADLTVVDGDPFRRFDDLVRTVWAMRDGVVYRADDLVADTTPAAARRRSADGVDWLDVSRQLRREPCCTEHAFAH